MLIRQIGKGWNFENGANILRVKLIAYQTKENKQKTKNKKKNTKQNKENNGLIPI